MDKLLYIGILEANFKANTPIVSKGGKDWLTHDREQPDTLT